MIVSAEHVGDVSCIMPRVSCIMRIMWCKQSTTYWQDPVQKVLTLSGSLSMAARQGMRGSSANEDEYILTHQQMRATGMYTYLTSITC
jgi:hypothetical protein